MKKSVTDKALEIDPKDTYVLIDKGVALQELEKYEEAIHCYDKALEIDPKNANTWHNKGHLLDELGLHNEAKLCYYKVLEIDSETTVSLSQVAEV